MATHADTRDSRLGTVGNVLLGLAGIFLVAAGITNLLAFNLADIPALAPGDNTTNTIASAVLVFLGLAGNLAAVADRA